MVQTNLKVLKRSNVPPKAGDIFVMQLPSDEYLFGRVILADAPRERAPMPCSHLLYIYDRRSAVPQAEISDLRPGRLLIPPVWTNRKAWTKGCFRTIGNRPLERFDLLKQHCFLRLAFGPGRPDAVVDETGRVLTQRTEPCGSWALPVTAGSTTV